MKNIEEKIESQISRIKLEIADITDNIESFRNDGDVDNVGVGQELLDKLEILNEKLNILKQNLLMYQSARNSQALSVGHTINISRERGGEQTITLVLPDDADSTEGFISAESPLGKALVGKREGEQVVFETPAGSQKMTINKFY